MKFANILKNRDFRYLWSSTLISLVGSGISSFALMWWIYKETGSPLKMGGIALVSAITSFVASPFLGSAIDYFKKHRDFLIAIDFISAVVMSNIAILMYLHKYSLPCYYVLVAVQTALTISKNACNQGLMQKIIINADYEKATAIWSFSCNGSYMIGPILGGILISIFSAPFVIVIDAISFIVSAFLKMPISVNGCAVRNDSKKSSFFQMSKEGITYLKNHKTIFGLMILFGVLGLFAGALPVIMIVFVTDVLQRGASFYGLMQTVSIVGIFSSSLILSFLPLPQKNRQYVILITILVQSIGLFLMGRFELAIISLIVMWFFGAGESVYQVILNSYALRNVDSSQIGRFFTYFSTLNFAFRPISIFIFTLLLEKFSSGLILQFLSLAIMCLSFMVLIIPGIKTIGIVEHKLVLEVSTVQD